MNFKDNLESGVSLGMRIISRCTEGFLNPGTHAQQPQAPSRPGSPRRPVRHKEGIGRSYSGDLNLSKHPGYMHRLRNKSLESSTVESNLGVLVDGKLNLSHVTLAARRASWGASGTAWPAGQGRGLSCIGHLHLEHCVQFWVPATI